MIIIDDYLPETVFEEVIKDDHWGDDNLGVSVTRPVGPQKDTSCSQYATDIPQNIQRAGKHLEWLPVGILQRWQYVEKDIEQVHGQ